MKLARIAGATSNILQVFIRDSSSTTGAGLTGLAYNSASLTAYYHRDTDTTATAITLVTMTVGTFTSSGFKEIDATNMPGWYQFCPPDAAFASGAKSVGLHLKGATNMAPLPIEIDLDAQVDLEKIAGTTSAGAAGYVGLDWGHINAPTTAVDLSGTTIKNLDNNPPGTLTAAQIATGVWQDTTAGDFTVTSSIGKSLYTSGNAPGAASGIALVGSNMGTVSSVTAAVATTSNRKKASSWSYDFLMQDATTGAGKTGLTVAATIRKDGGLAASTTNAVTELDNGYYRITFTGTETNCNTLAFRATATGASDRYIEILTQP